MYVYKRQSPLIAIVFNLTLANKYRLAQFDVACIPKCLHMTPFRFLLISLDKLML